MRSKKGIKKSAFQAATDIHEVIKRNFRYGPKPPLLVTGHSKGGLEAIAYKYLFGADWCVAFNPARGMRYWIDRRLWNTAIFTDPDDFVNYAGMVSFGHPICKHYKGEYDTPFFRIKEHDINKWESFIDDL